MNKLRTYAGKLVSVEISGGKTLTGMVADLGSDLLVLAMGDRYSYIPFVHVQTLKEVTKGTEGVNGGVTPKLTPMPVQVDADVISYRKLLMHIRGQFVELYVAGRGAVHGYLTSVMNDYFVFYSPVYKMVYISLEHVKWLVPYPSNVTPYSLNDSLLPVNPKSIPLSRSFEEQCGKLVGQLVVFDFGDKEEKVGLLRAVEDHLVELVNAGGDTCYWNLRHLKSVHLP